MFAGLSVKKFTPRVKNQFMFHGTKRSKIHDNLAQPYGKKTARLNQNCFTAIEYCLGKFSFIHIYFGIFFSIIIKSIQKVQARKLDEIDRSRVSLHYLFYTLGKAINSLLSTATKYRLLPELLTIYSNDLKFYIGLSNFQNF